MTSQLAYEIQLEQSHGRKKYGRGEDDFAHDDAHAEHEWHSYIADMNERARYDTPADRRQRLIKVAGLAVSAIESHDRKQNL